MFDLMIRGGDVVTPEGVVRCDVAVVGETIAEIATSGTLSADAAKHVIDATAHIVMPGGIDPHVHLHHGEWGARRSIPVHSAREFA
jgi:dihydroorotase-like cyclic amidohydrolase